MPDDFWRLKIAALLHDPIIKPFVIILRKGRHEEKYKHESVAKDIAKEIGVAKIKVEDASIGWLIAKHHPPNSERKSEEYNRWCEFKEKIFPLKAIIEADHNSSATDRIPMKGVKEVKEILPIHPLSGERLSALRITYIDYSQLEEIKFQLKKSQNGN